MTSIVILTGAGISAESGVSTFRDPDGIWAKVDYREVATPEGFAANPGKIHDFYNMRRAGLTGIKPNAAHLALAELERGHAGDFLLVTQNIDHLHEAAASQEIIHMHGELARALCSHCSMRVAWADDLNAATPCPRCGDTGGMRPDVVWFGEMPYRMDEIYDALAACNLFVSIGTSGKVYPAAGFVTEARAAGAHTVELNLEPSEGASLFAEVIHGRATEIVPTFVERVLERFMFRWKQFCFPVREAIREEGRARAYREYGQAARQSGCPRTGNLKGRAYLRQIHRSAARPDGQSGRSRRSSTLPQIRSGRTIPSKHEAL